MSLNDVDINLRDGLFLSDIGIVNLHPSRGTHWVCYKNENYFDSHGCVCPKNLSKFNIKGNGQCLYSEYKKQGLTCKRDSYSSSHCLYMFYSTKVEGLDFKSPVLNLFYQRIS